MNEQELIARAAEGDETAFEALVEQTQRMVYHICLRMTADADDALDLSQETYLKAWHAIALFHGEAKFSTWLCRIAANTCLDHLRKQKRKRAVSTVSLDEELPLARQIADYSQDPAVLAEKAADRAAVMEAFSLLPDEDRLLLSLRAMEDMSYEEIAEATDLKTGTVKSRIFRAREKIRRSLGGNFSEKDTSDKVKGGLRK